MVTRALLVLALLGGIARANPILVDRDPPPPPPPVQLVEQPPPPPDEPLYTRLGLRIGAGAFPFHHRGITAAGMIQIEADVELFARTRAFAEYAVLFLSPRESRMDDPNSSTLDHRFDAGLTVDAIGTTVSDLRFYGAVEAGGGVDLISGWLGRDAVPHGFVGVRAGFSLTLDHEAKRPPSFDFELLVRAMVVPEGAGMLFGLGMLWGR